MSLPILSHELTFFTLKWKIAKLIVVLQVVAENVNIVLTIFGPLAFFPFRQRFPSVAYLEKLNMREYFTASDSFTHQLMRQVESIMKIWCRRSFPMVRRPFDPVWREDVFASSTKSFSRLLRHMIA